MSPTINPILPTDEIAPACGADAELADDASHGEGHDLGIYTARNLGESDAKKK